MSPARCYILLLITTIVFATVSVSYGQDSRKKVEDEVYLNLENDYLNDTTDTRRWRGKNKDNVYNKMKGSKSWLVRNFANLILIGGDPSLQSNNVDDKLQLSKNYFKNYEGLIIDSIDIVRKEIYSQDDSMSTNSWIERTLDNIHVVSRERVIRKYLMFQEGDTIDAGTFSTNEYVLRKLPFLGSAFIVVTINKNSHAVVHVYTRDMWTILAWGELGDFPQLTVFDKNFLGLGDELGLTYLHNGKRQKTGVQAYYIFRNIKGKFVDAEIHTGIGGTTKSFWGSIQRDYIKPGDRFWKVQGGYKKYGEGQKFYDTTFLISHTNIELSYGKSHIVNKEKEIAFYHYVGFQHTNYHERPPVAYHYNPYYMDATSCGIGIGFNQQLYFQSNMIYGYGIIEDIPYGFKAELTGGYGYSRQEKNFYLLGAHFKYGFFAKNVGYFDFSLKASTYYSTTDKDYIMGVLDIGGKYFSPLFSLGRGYFLRNFITFRMTNGLNRLYGEREGLDYNSEGDIRGMRTPYDQKAHNRMVINLESVFFSPIYLLHFRLAYFGWSDFGWLGDDPLFWKNKACSAFGIGIRIKNERLIIDNVELRLGFQIMGYPGMSYRTIGINTESRLKIDSYAPGNFKAFDYE